MIRLLDQQGRPTRSSLPYTLISDGTLTPTDPNSSIWGGIISNESAAKPSGSIDGMKQQGMP